MLGCGVSECTCGEMCGGVRKCRERYEESCGRVHGVSVEAVVKCVGVGEGRCAERCEEVLEEVWESVLEFGVDMGRGVRKCWGRCGKVCWGEGRCGEFLEEVWESVRGEV